jgi:hypothetical protein
VKERERVEIVRGGGEKEWYSPTDRGALLQTLTSPTGKKM